jgi:transposase, IS6 family
VRWYVHYTVSHSDVEELMRKCDVWIDHTWVFRWIQRYAPALDFMPNATPDADAAEYFFRQVIQALHTLTPRMITVDQHVSFPHAFKAFQKACSKRAVCSGNARF